MHDCTTVRLKVKRSLFCSRALMGWNFPYGLTIFFVVAVVVCLFVFKQCPAKGVMSRTL